MKITKEDMKKELRAGALDVIERMESQKKFHTNPLPDKVKERLVDMFISLHLSLRKDLGVDEE